MSSCDILKDISDHVTLVQLLDSLGYVNHTISVVGCWIFDSNDEKAIIIHRKYLDMIFAPSVGDK